MKLLITTDTIGGVWTFTIDLIKALKTFNTEILLASLGHFPSECQQEEIKEFSYVKFKPSEYKMEWMDNPWRDLEIAAKWIAEISKEFEPDVVHLNSFSFDPKLFNTPVILTGHSCVSSWWEQVKNEFLPSSWDPYFNKVKETVQKADALIAPSEFMLRKLTQFYGPVRRSGVIYNAGDSDCFDSSQLKDQVVFSMGRIWDEAKNMKLLIEAADYCDLPVFIAGDNKNFNNSIPTNVKFTGQLSKQEIASRLTRASIFVLPSLYEPFGLSALEAAFSGCALLLADIPSLREIWGDAAVYFNPRDVKELAEKINEVNRNEHLRDELKNRALQRSQRYKLKIFAAKYYSWYLTIKTTVQKSSVLYY